MQGKPIKKVDLYADGACSGNPGRGAWGTILVYNGHEKILTGSAKETTNNRMELMGVINGLEVLNRPCSVTAYTDSQYVVNAVNQGWLEKWSMSGWVKPDKKPVKNRDLWEYLLELMGTHSVTFVWVKGHADNAYNNRCDKIAVDSIKKFAGMENGEYP